MATKKASKKAAARPAARAASPVAVPAGSRLIGAVYHGGRMYSPKKKGDAEAFARLIGEEKGQISRAALQRLANAGVIAGFGTTAKADVEPEVETVLDENPEDEQPE